MPLLSEHLAALQYDLNKLGHKLRMLRNRVAQQDQLPGPSRSQQQNLHSNGSLFWDALDVNGPRGTKPPRTARKATGLSKSKRTVRK
jgi:hypothetical protein